MKENMKLIIMQPLLILVWLQAVQAQDFLLGNVQSQLASEVKEDQLQFEEIDGLMFVKVRLNDSKVFFRFLLDTGAPTGISPEIARIVRPKLGQKVLVQSSGAKEDSLGLVLIDSVHIGNLSFTQIVAFVADFSQGEIMKCYQVDGIIGGNLMATAIWQFDKQAKEVRVTQKLKSLKYTRKAKPLNIELYGWQKSPLMDISINNRRINEKVMLDTGYGGFFSWSRSTFWEANKRNFIDSTQILKGSGTAVETIFGKDADSVVYNVQLDELVLGNLSFQGPVVDVDLDKGSKLGVELLDNYILTLDFLKKRAYFYEVSKKPQVINLKSFGFSAYVRQNDIYVTLLWENSPAKKAGIKLYDRIVEINGVSFRQIDAYNKCLLFLKLRSILLHQDEIEISFASEGETRTTRIRKEVLLGD